MELEFFVPGTPVPKGSAKAVGTKSNGKTIIRQDNAAKQKPWAMSIGFTALQAMKGRSLITGPVALSLAFTCPRPKADFAASGLVRPSAPRHHVKKPDLDKLVRCVKDALTGVVWQDDSQVCFFDHVSKTYETVSRGSGVKVTIRAI